MNLAKLFETQKVLRDRINYNEPDRFNKLILALLVEIGECANCWRGFKFWSKDQEPRITKKCIMCDGLGNDIYYTGSLDAGTLQECSEPCEYCDGMGNDDSENPLLEEYVDALHFVLELGIEINANDIQHAFIPSNVVLFSDGYIAEQFNNVFEQVMAFKDEHEYMRNNDEFEEYENLVYTFLGLGEILGFTWEQIEQAYYEKNEVNHLRQSTGY